MLVEVVPLTLAAAEGATLLATLARGAALLLVPDPVVLPEVPLEALVLPLAVQDGLLAPVLPVVDGAVDPIADGPVELAVDGRVLAVAPVVAGAEAATLVRGAPLAAAPGPVADPVLVGADVLALLPHAASTKEAAASVGRSGFSIMD